MTSPEQTKQRLRALGLAHGFQQIGFTGTDLGDDEKRLDAWLAAGCHGDMTYMARHGHRRSRPRALLPTTRTVISVRLDYLPGDAAAAERLLDHPSRAYVSRYALGRDYHKLLRNRLQHFADAATAAIGPFGYRAFVDSAPVLEKPLARNAGLGWVGKHTNLINTRAGSWFFLGELYTDLALPSDPPMTADHCGSCRRCIDICPTGAITAPYKLDARRCISYLTIEYRGSIPEAFRAAIGNRIYGCDDCQIACPWNKFARPTAERDFAPRHGLDTAELTALFAWSEQDWDSRTRGSAIRRIGYECWLRNIAVALGNAARTPAVLAALESRREHPSALVREHVSWALAQQRLAG